ncbi:MAG: hypothetical protein WBB55_14730 [Anaerolineales bacterium]
MTENQNPQESGTPEVVSQAAASQAAEAQDTSRHTGRKFAIDLLVVLGLILLAVGNLVFWARFTLLNTNGWVTAVGPLSKDPTVSGILSQYVVGELFAQVDVEQSLAEALPPKLQIFSAPLAVGVQQFADNTVNSLIQSDAFNTVWVGVNRTGHTAIISVLKGEGDKLYMQDGQLTLDLSDVYNFVENKFGLTDLDLVPAASGGKLVLFESQQVAYLQEIVSYLNTFGLLLPLLGILAFVLAWFVYLWRRETLIWIGIVLALTMLVSLIVFSVVRSNILVNVANPMLRDLGRQILYVVTHGLFVQTVFGMIVGILLAIGAWQSTPDSTMSKWEASLKGKSASKKASEDTSA